MPGVGKTHIAVEYAYRHRDDYESVFWGNADTLSSLTSDLANLAQVLDLPQKNEIDEKLVLSAVRRWLVGHPGWLLILDNASDLKTIRELIPLDGPGHLLLTTRDASSIRLAEPVPVEQMSSEEGGELLLHRASLLSQDVPFDGAERAAREDALALSERLGGLPLALDQAGAFIAETAVSPAEYLRFYEAEGHRLRERSNELADHISVTTTFSVAFARVERLDPAAADLLRLCAFLAPDAIPEEILAGGGKELGERLGPAVASPLNLATAVGIVHRLSLLRRNSTARTLTVHRVVQEVLRDGMDAEALRVWAGRAIRAVNQAFPAVKSANWPACDRLLPHALACTAHGEHLTIDLPEAGHLLHVCGMYQFDRRDRFAAAADLLRRALAIREKVQGPENPDTAQTLNALGRLYSGNYGRGKASEAEALFRRALAIRESVLGPEHPDTAETLNAWAYLDFVIVGDVSNGILYHTGPNGPRSKEDQLQYARSKEVEAEARFRRALAIREKVLGAEHPDTAQTLSYLGLLFYKQGKTSEAEQLFRKAVEILTKARGNEDPETAENLNNLAVVLDRLSQRKEAKALTWQAFKIRKKVIGRQTTATVQSLANLARIAQSEGNYRRAELLYRRAHDILEMIYGPDDPEPKGPFFNMAEMYIQLGRPDEAERILQRALTEIEKALGPESQVIGRACQVLADFYHHQHRYNDAEPLYQRALAIREKLLGVWHPDVVVDIESLARNYYAQGNVVEGDSLSRRMRAISMKDRLPEDYKSAKMTIGHAHYLANTMNLEGAETLLRRKLAFRENILDPEPPDVALMLDFLADIISCMGRNDEATALRDRARAIWASYPDLESVTQRKESPAKRIG